MKYQKKRKVSVKPIGPRTPETVKLRYKAPINYSKNNFLRDIKETMYFPIPLCSAVADVHSLTRIPNSKKISYDFEKKMGWVISLAKQGSNDDKVYRRECLMLHGYLGIGIKTDGNCLCDVPFQVSMLDKRTWNIGKMLVDVHWFLNKVDVKTDLLG
ncbi:hypothetical protein [Bacteroides acidifaciens]|uniref:hypothetical protein n=1 Tax=Bacteroides acidifaciens TaxID=85831 RepID=UPI003F68ECF4